MMNVIWLILMVGGFFIAGINGKIQLVTQSAMYGAQEAVSLSYKLIGVMCLWLGVMKIAEDSGLIKLFSKLMSPLVQLIFPSIPKNHPAVGAVTITITANMAGMGNAVTPLGIKAMQELQKLSAKKDTATPAMCTLLALCTAGFTIIPATIIALRAAAGSVNPTIIIGPTLITSFLTTIIVLVADRLCRILFTGR